MNRNPEYFAHVQLIYEDTATRSAFSTARAIAALHDIKDWLRPVERAIFRANLRDVGERNTTMTRIGPTYLAFELEAADRRPNQDPADVQVRIRGHYIPKNRGGAEAAFNAQRSSWFEAFGNPARRGAEAVRARALHRVNMRLFDPFARYALSCAKPAGRVAGGWIAMVQGYAQRVVDDGQDEGAAVVAMKRLILRRQFKECDAA